MFASISKIFETLGMTIVGAVIGALAGIMISMSIFAISRFPIYAVAVFLGLTLIFRITKALKRHDSTFISDLAVAARFSVWIAGFGGIFYFFSEEADYEDFDVYVIIGITVCCIPVYMLLTPLRTVWKDSLLYNKICVPLDGFKSYFRRKVD